MLDERTREYLMSHQKNVIKFGVSPWSVDTQLQKAGISYREEKLSDKYTLFSYVNNSGKRYAAQFLEKTAVDDYDFVYVIFSKKPSLRDVEVALASQDLKILFGSGIADTTFKCHECGIEKHFLDLEGSIFEKIDLLADRYCGC